MTNTNENIDFDSIAAMLVGKKLSDDQIKDVENLKKEYEEVHNIKNLRVQKNDIKN